MILAAHQSRADPRPAPARRRHPRRRHQPCRLQGPTAARASPGSRSAPASSSLTTIRCRRRRQAIDREPHWLGHSYLALWTATRLGRAHLDPLPHASIRARRERPRGRHLRHALRTCRRFTAGAPSSRADRHALRRVTTGSPTMDKGKENARPAGVDACATRDLGLDVRRHCGTRLSLLAAHDFAAYRALYVPSRQRSTVT